MRPNVTEIAQARETLGAEVELLKNKVASGATLRVGERRFLLGMLEPIESESQRIRGAFFACEELAPGLCAKCRGKVVQPYMHTLREAAAEIGETL